MLRDARFIAFQDLKHMLRQKETLIWVFLMPPLFFYFVGTVTGGFGSPPPADAKIPMAVVAPTDSGFLLDVVIERLEAQGYRSVRFDPDGNPFPSSGDAAATRRDDSAADGAGDDDAAGDGGSSAGATPDAAPPPLERYTRQLHVPGPPAGHASMTEAVLAGDPVELGFRRSGDELAANYDKVRVARAVYGVLADLAVLRVEEAGAAIDTRAGFDRLAEMPRTLSLTVESAGQREDPPSGFAQAVPGTTVMFTLLVLLTSGSILLVIERRQGLLRRLASTPISRGSVVAGKWTARTALGVVQVAYGMVIGAMMFGMDWGGSLPVLVLVLAAWTGFCASLTILLANVARTEAQMSGIGVMATMALAALGGCWWPIEITPDWMQSLAMALPTGWTMDAMHKLVNFGYGATAALPHLIALTAGTLLIGVAAAKTFRYQ